MLVSFFTLSRYVLFDFVSGSKETKTNAELFVNVFVARTSDASRGAFNKTFFVFACLQKKKNIQHFFLHPSQHFFTGYWALGFVCVCAIQNKWCCLTK